MGFPSPPVTARATSGTVPLLLAAADDYDYDACDRLFESALRQMEPLALIRDVASPVLHEAGNRWHRGEWAVVQEHLLSGVVRRRLSAALDRHLGHAAGPAILFATLSGERHELGGLMGAFLAASQGFRSIYLGPDLPASELCLFCARRPVAALALSLVTQPDVNDARLQLAELRHCVPMTTEIWVAGRAALLISLDQLPAGVVALAELAEFLDRLAQLNKRLS